MSNGPIQICLQCLSNPESICPHDGEGPYVEVADPSVLQAAEARALAELRQFGAANMWLYTSAPYAMLGVRDPTAESTVTQLRTALEEIAAPSGTFDKPADAFQRIARAALATPTVDKERVCPECGSNDPMFCVGSCGNKLGLPTAHAHNRFGRVDCCPNPFHGTGQVQTASPDTASAPPVDEGER